MKKKFFFISGLARSGSTLLSSILTQHKDIHSDIASPLGAILDQYLHLYDDGFNKILTPQKIKKLIKNSIETLYDDFENPIIFDVNRTHTNNLSVLVDMFPDTKMICMVRSIPDILNSFENIYQKNLYKGNSNLYGMDTISVYQRCWSLMNPTGVVALGLNYLKQSLHGPHADRILLIEYEELVNDTENVINDVYDFLELPRFEHDFNNLKNIPGSEIVDQELNLEGLHSIRPSISKSENSWLLPFDLAEQFSNLEYWRRLSTDPNDSLPLDEQVSSDGQ
jgi:sulfotransferase